MGAKIARKNRPPARSPYLSNLGGGAGERVLPPAPDCPTTIARALPENPEALARLASLYAANCTELIACHDPSGRILWASERAREVLGRAAGEVLGRRLDDLVAPEDREVVEEAFSRLSEHGATATCSYRIRLRNGRRRCVESTFRAIVDGRAELREVQSSTRSAGPHRTGGHPSGDGRFAFRRLRELAAHLESVREEERSAMAREIHDDLGHQLTALGLDLSGLAQDLSGATPEIAARVKRMQAANVEILASIRRIVTELRPAVLDGFGLPAAIEWQAGDFSLRTGIATHVEVEEEDLKLDGRSASAVFRIFQEALTNVARHAGASVVSAALRRKDRAIELEVSDDGRGFEPAAASTGSYGLIGMRERALALDGVLQIESGTGQGTTVRLRVPL